MIQPAEPPRRKKPLSHRAALAVLQILVIVIYATAVYDKLTSDSVTVQTFRTLDMEPNGRYLVALIELTCIVLLLVPGAAIFGALLSLCVMMGALIAHATHLGVWGPMMPMCAKACAVALASLGIVYLRREQVPAIRDMFEMKI